MKNLFLIALLAMLSALTAGIKLKNKVVQDPAGDPAGSGAGSGDPAGSTPSGTDQTPSPLTREALLEILNSINQAEELLRTHYFDALSEEGAPLVANKTDIHPCDKGKDEAEDYCGGKFNRENWYPHVMFYSDNMGGMIKASNYSESMLKYIDYVKQTAQTCADPVSGAWSSPLTAGYTDEETGFFHFMYGGSRDNIQHWNLTLFDQDLKAGCLAFWESHEYNYDQYNYQNSYNGQRYLREICWDVQGKCEDKLEITQDDSEANKAYKNISNILLGF